MRQYLCECSACKNQYTLWFDQEPFPILGDSFPRQCLNCGKATPFQRVATRKAISLSVRCHSDSVSELEIWLSCSQEDPLAWEHLSGQSWNWNSCRPSQAVWGEENLLARGYFLYWPPRSVESETTEERVLKWRRAGSPVYKIGPAEKLFSS